MSQNVAEAIETKSGNLFDKLCSNGDVSNLIMALVGRLVIMAHQMGKPLEGIAIDKAVWSGRKLSARIVFNSLIIPSPGIWAGQSDLKIYVASKAANLARVFDKNSGVLVFFNDFVNKLDQFCTHKSIAFKDLKLEKSIITPDNILMVSVSIDHLGKWER